MLSGFSVFPVDFMSPLTATPVVLRTRCTVPAVFSSRSLGQSLVCASACLGSIALALWIPCDTFPETELLCVFDFSTTNSLELVGFSLGFFFLGST